VQALPEPLEPVAEPVEVAGRPRSRAFGQLVVGDQLPHGRDLHADDGPGRQLRRRHELAERLDLVAPVLEADRATRGPGEDVEDAAADRELAAMFDHVRARVPERDQPLGEIVRRQLDPLDQLDRRDLAEGGDEALHRGERGGDQDERALGRPQPAHGLGPARRDLRRGADPFVRERLPRGQERRPVLAKPRPRAAGEPLRLPRAGRDEQHRRAERPGEGRHQRVLARVRACDDRRARSSSSRSNASEPISASSACSRLT
jgi:hypothetical protein